MMQFKENEPLSLHTTFHIGGPARYYCIAADLVELKEALDFAKGKNLKVLVMGGGSNMLVSDKGFDGLVIKIENKGQKIFAEYDHQLELEVAAGEVWDEVVESAVTNGWWGIENLSHIPGKTGAIAVQNVGAYGQEASQVLSRVISLDTFSYELIDHQSGDFQFGYRRSIYNREYKGRYVILYLTMRLSKTPKPNLAYRDLQARFVKDQPKLKDVREAVIEIRNKKFPFPKEAVNGNAGSFFKNVILDKNGFMALQERVKQEFGAEALEGLNSKIFITGSSEEAKVPTAFLLELCGLKDLSEGGAAINHNQPLVIINATGKATAQNILNLANHVKETVKAKTGLDLEQEPELVGF